MEDSFAIKNLRTGDLILFDSLSGGLLYYFDKLIKYFTNSKFNHIGMVVKDPTFTDKQLKGLYLWESGWEGTPDPQDGKVKLGVQFTPLKEAIRNNNGTIYIRKLQCSESLYNAIFTEDNLRKVHEVVKDKPYDIVPDDWINAISRKDTHPKKTDRFWCSALVGYIYSKLNILDQSIDWSVLRPSDFSIEDKMEHINLLDGFSLSNYQIEYNCN